MTVDPDAKDERAGKFPHRITLLVVVVSLPTLLTAAFFASIAYDTWASAPEAASSQQRIEQSLQTIRMRPEDLKIESSFSSKSHHGYAGAYFRSSASYATLRAYYDAELASHGWVLCREKPVREWGRDTGGSTLVYLNGIDSLSLTYSGEPARDGWNYAIDVVWGQGSDCGD